MSDTPTSITLLHLNINGLDDGKLSYVTSLMASRPTIVLLSEHWYVHYNQLSTHPFFMVSSPRPPKAILASRNTAGLAILVSQDIRHLCSIVYKHNYCLVMDVSGYKIAFVYFPPSLDDSIVKTILKEIPYSVSLIVGDVNVRYGVLTRDTTTLRPGRGRVITEFTAPRGLVHRICAGTECSRNDHVYSVNPVEWKYDWQVKQHVNTDHGLMTLTLPNINSPAVGIATSKRFGYAALKSPMLSNLMTSDWDLLYAPLLMHLLATTQQQLLSGQFSAVSYQEIVDGVYDIWKYCLTELAKRHLHVYNPVQVKTNYDLTGLKNSTSNADNVRIFKRAQRGNGSSVTWVSRSTKLVSIEAIEHYQALYNHIELDNTELPPKLAVIIDDPLRFKITAKEIQQTILQYPSHKSGGPDGLDTQYYKCLTKSATFCDLMAILFDIFYMIGTTPSEWNTSRIYLLAKDPLEAFIDKSRPIALTNIGRRLFEKILLKLWSSDCQPWTTFHPCQSGFRSGHSTTMQVCVADELSRQGNPISIYLDLKSAYDTVPYAQLYNALQSRGCPQRDLALIYSLMIDNCTSTLVVNHTELDTRITRQRGLFQGSILSPFLFNCFIDSLGHNANNAHEIPKLLLFADDICIKASDAVEAQRLLDHCFEWAKVNLMSFGIAKCGVMAALSENQTFTLGNDIVPIVKSYKYLGVPFTRKGANWIELHANQHAKATAILSSLMFARHIWLHQTRIIIWKTFIQPIYSYCRGPYLYWLIKQDDTVKHASCQIETKLHELELMFLFGYTTPLATLDVLALLHPSDIRKQWFKASFVKHLCSAALDNPIHEVQRRIVIPTMSRSSFLELCTQHPYVRLWENKWIDCQSDLSPTGVWKKLQSQMFWDSLPLYKQTLPMYFNRRAMHVTRNIWDAFTQSKQLSSDIVVWRINRFGHGKYCPRCYRRFNRRHITDCYLLSNVPEYQQLLNDYGFKQLRASTSTALQLFAKECTYSVLDHCLNLKLYSTFKLLRSKLVDMLL
jgi:hypothetical protein